VKACQTPAKAFERHRMTHKESRLRNKKIIADFRRGITVAKLCSCYSCPSVDSILQKAGISTKRSYNARNSAIATAYKNGKTMIFLGKRHKLTWRTIRNILTCEGVRVRHKPHLRLLDVLGYYYRCRSQKLTAEHFNITKQCVSFYIVAARKAGLPGFI
jgi:Mor family transcriptional regulator